MAPWLLLACTGGEGSALYRAPVPMNEVEEEEAAVAEQDIALSPAELDLGPVCDEASAVLVLQNAGEVELRIYSVAIEGRGWEVDLSGVSGRVGAGEEVVLPLSTSGGLANLEVYSDDPDEEIVRLPLASRSADCGDTGDTGAWGDTGDTGAPF